MPLPKAKSNSLLSNSFFIFIIRLFPSLANLVVLIWYSRSLPQDAYGSYQHFWIQMNVIYPLACFGIHVLVITYSKEFIVALFRKLQTSHYVLYGSWIAALSAVFALLQCGALAITFIIPFLFLLSFTLSVLLESLLIVFRSYKSLTIISFLYSAVFCIAHIHVLKNGFSLQALFTLLLAITALRMFIYLLLFANQLRENSTAAFTGSIDVMKIRSLWLHLGLYDVLQILFNWIDKFIISLVLIAPLSAIYYNGSQTIPVLPLLLSAAGSAVLMQLASSDDQDETKSIINLVNESGKMLSCIVCPVFLYLFLFRQELIPVILTEKYVPAIPIFALAVLVLPLKAYSFTTALQRLHKGVVINAGAVGDLLLACLLMYPLYIWLGLPGVALSFVITTYLQAAFYLFYTAKLLKVSPLQLVPYANWLVKLIVFACAFIVIRYACNQYYRQEITLILGGVAMVLLIVGSLLLELQRQKRHGSN